MSNYKIKINSWIRLARLQFYPMPFATYSFGAVYSYKIIKHFDIVTFLLGYFCLFLIEFMTIICNEYFDMATDQLNTNRSIFNGGSGMIIQGRISSKEIGFAVTISTLLLCASMVFISPADQNSAGISHIVIVVLFLGIILGIGYTAPPLKFSYRGVGELVVAFTCGPYLIFCGAYFQSRQLTDPVPWLLGLPLFFAILPAIILSEILDYDADKAVGKRTIPVIWGKKRAFIFSVIFLLIPNFMSLVLLYYRLITGVVAIILLVTLPYAIILSGLCLKRIGGKKSHRRHSGLLVGSLAYMVWFIIVPYISILKK